MGVAGAWLGGLTNRLYFLGCNGVFLLFGYGESWDGDWGVEVGLVGWAREIGDVVWVCEDEWVGGILGEWWGELDGEYEALG